MAMDRATAAEVPLSLGEWRREIEPELMVFHQECLRRGLAETRRARDQNLRRAVSLDRAGVT